MKQIYRQPQTEAQIIEAENLVLFSLPIGSGDKYTDDNFAKQQDLLEDEEISDELDAINRYLPNKGYNIWDEE